MKELEIKKMLSKKFKPLVGNNRSRTRQAKRVTKRKFALNRQKFRINGKNYCVPVHLFRTYWAKLKRETES